MEEKDNVKGLGALIGAIEPMEGTTKQAAQDWEEFNPDITPFYKADPLLFLDPNEPLPETLSWCTIGGRKALPRNTLVGVQAMPGVGKSSAMWGIIQHLILSRGIDNMEPQDEAPKKVIVFDLELPKVTLQARMKNIRASLGDYADRFGVVPLMERNVKERLEIIEETIGKYTPDIILVDPIGSLCEDLNNPSECFGVVAWLLRLTNKATVLYACHLTEATQKAKGHIGKIAFEKANEVYGMKIVINNDIIELKPEKLRETSLSDAQPLRLKLTGAGITDPSVEVEQRRQKEQEDWHNNMVRIFAGDGAVIPFAAELTFTELRNRITEREGLDSRSAERKIKLATECGVMVKTKRGRNVFYALRNPRSNLRQLPS